MDSQALIARLEASRDVIAALVGRVSEEQGHWKPAPEKWSIVEVVNHLHSEEREDFRARLERTLRDPEEKWAPINPEGWVRERRFQERVLSESLQDFLRERNESLRWLRSLASPSWSNTHVHPAVTLSAGDLLTSWAAHDLLHIRQLARLQWQYLAVIAEPYSSRYAGEAPV